jgi:hypothetical protein
VSSELLTTRVLQILRLRSGRPRLGLDQLASELRLTLERLGYEAMEPHISPGPPTARLRILFRGDGEAFSLLLHGGRPGMVHRHLTGYIRQNSPIMPLDEALLGKLLSALDQGNDPFPVLEVGWQRSWRRLVGLLPYSLGGELIAVVFDRVAGRTSGPHHRSMCRVAVLSRGAICIHLLDLVRSIVPPGPRRLKYRGADGATIDEPQH